MLNVLIAENNMQKSINLSNTINTQNVRCVGILNEETKVYQRIKVLNPDILILDIDISNNGLDILDKIQSDSQIKTKVFIYVDEKEHETLANYECIIKFFSKLTPAEEIARELEVLVDETFYKTTQDKISNILFKLGFTYSMKGTKLMNDCILYSIVKNEDKLKNIYKEIAKEKKENSYTIKSDINTAIRKMWNHTDKKKTRRILRLGEEDTPSSKDIIEMIKYYVK